MAYEFASRLETFPNYRKFETTFAGRPFVVETGKMCGLSNGSAMIRSGSGAPSSLAPHTRPSALLSRISSSTPITEGSSSAI